MPSPGSGALAASRLPIEETYLELLAEMLDGMDVCSRGQFLQRYFRTTTHLELHEAKCLQLWSKCSQIAKSFPNKWVAPFR